MIYSTDFLFKIASLNSTPKTKYIKFFLQLVFAIKDSNNNEVGRLIDWQIACCSSLL